MILKWQSNNPHDEVHGDVIVEEEVFQFGRIPGEMRINPLPLHPFQSHTGRSDTGDSYRPPIQGGSRSYILPLTEATLRSTLFPISIEALKRLTTRMVRPKPAGPEPQGSGPESPEPHWSVNTTIKHTAPQSPTHFWATAMSKLAMCAFGPTRCTTYNRSSQTGEYQSVGPPRAPVDSQCKQASVSLAWMNLGQNLQLNEHVSRVTILLSLTVFLNLVAEKMPSTSDAVPLIGRVRLLP
uniref:Neurotransmitter-gated ion-channel transmembrane domain-containing protein n=1 Tax=Timema shepardi TaxID=629360 RepID=A0A7R9FWH1_TIMSH|nr:unnamed protein product [Timema shepardi]